MSLLLLAAFLAIPSVADSSLPANFAGRPLGQARKTKAQPHALLFGTVFDDSGRLVRGAQVTVRLRPSSNPRPSGSKPLRSKGVWEGSSDSQGEFAVHLPPGPNVYVVEAHSPGLELDRKEVEFTSDERQDVVLHLKRP